MILRPADALAVLHRAEAESRWGTRGRRRPPSVRTCALLALAAAGLTSSEIAALRANAVSLVEGRAVVTVERKAGQWSVTLVPLLARPVMSWLTASRLWGEPGHLFSETGEPLTSAAIRKRLARHLPPHRRRRRQTTRGNKRSGPPAAVVNPHELLALWEGRGGRRPLSMRAIARNLGVSPPTALRRLEALRAAGQVDDEARARGLARGGGKTLNRTGPKPRPIDDAALQAAWSRHPSISGVARRLRVSRRRIRARLQHLNLLRPERTE